MRHQPLKMSTGVKSPVLTLLFFFPTRFSLTCAIFFAYQACLLDFVLGHGCGDWGIVIMGSVFDYHGRYTSRAFGYGTALLYKTQKRSRVRIRLAPIIFQGPQNQNSSDHNTHSSRRDSPLSTTRAKVRLVYVNGHMRQASASSSAPFMLAYSPVSRKLPIAAA